MERIFCSTRFLQSASGAHVFAVPDDVDNTYLKHFSFRFAFRFSFRFLYWFLVVSALSGRTMSRSGSDAESDSQDAKASWPVSPPLSMDAKTSKDVYLAILDEEGMDDASLKEAISNLGESIELLSGQDLRPLAKRLGLWSSGDSQSKAALQPKILRWLRGSRARTPSPRASADKEHPTSSTSGRGNPHAETGNGGVA